MADTDNWVFPERFQPDEADVRFDLSAVLDAVVALRAEVPEDAFTAGVLGTERVGNGIVIGNDGLVLTIGYLITEASTIWLTNNQGTVVPGHALAYDFESGLGLVQPLQRLDAPALPRGTMRSVNIGDEVFVIGHGGRSHALKARLFAKREFAGYWEYVLDQALFTTPPHPEWSGAALVGHDGRLVGIGSLFVQEMIDGDALKGNMFVPADLLEPIQDDLVRYGRPNRPARPWLGLYAAESEQRLIVHGLAKGGPADRAGVQLGDIVAEVAGKPVSDLAQLFRSVWRLGPAGTEIPLTVLRAGASRRCAIRSSDRGKHLKQPSLQ
jgi:S1-C subfamily serine protease